jgi:hypothetical protein
MLGISEQFLTSAAQPPPPPPPTSGAELFLSLSKFAVGPSVKTISPQSTLLAPTAAQLSRQSEVKRDHHHRHLVKEDHEAVSRRGIMPRTVSPDQAMRRDATVAYAQHQRAQAVMSSRSNEDVQSQRNLEWGKTLPAPNLLRQQLERAPPPPPPPPPTRSGFEVPGQFVVRASKPNIVLGI